MRSEVMAALAAAFVATVAWAQPRSAIEFYDTTGSEATARLGWQGPRGSGKLFVESPVGTELLNMQAGRMTVNGEVSAAQFRGDGRGLSGVADSAHTHTLAQIAPDGITSADIKDSTITTADIRDSAITSAKIRNGTIIDPDIHPVARISGTKVVPDFGAQNIKTTGLIELPERNGTRLFSIDAKYHPNGLPAIELKKWNGQTYLGEVFHIENVSAATCSNYATFFGDFNATGRITAEEMACVSDARLKTNIRTVDSALTKITALRAVEFSWCEGTRGMGDSRQSVGVIAQEVETVVPAAVVTDRRGYKSVLYDNLTALLVQAIKEQQILLERQAADIEQLKRLVGAESR